MNYGPNNPERETDESKPTLEALLREVMGRIHKDLFGEYGQAEEISHTALEHKPDTNVEVKGDAAIEKPGTNEAVDPTGREPN